MIMTSKNRFISKTAALIRLSLKKINAVVRFFSKDIWELDVTDLSRFKARLVMDYKQLMVMLRAFSVQKIGFQGKALSYLCTMSIVPSLAIAFWLTRHLNLADELKSFLYANLKDQHLIDILLNSADNILKTAQSGLFGLISSLTFIWMVIWMMICVERVFNSVWLVNEKRKFWKEVSVIFAILLTAPFVIIIFFSGSVVYSHVLDLVVPSKIAFSDSIKSFLAWAVFFGVSVMTFAMMFKYIPNKKVKFKYAFRAAIWTGLAFTIVQYLYLETQVFVTRQSAIYGVLAAIPMFMIWLNMGWTIILYGAELSFALQSLSTQDINLENIDDFLDELKTHKYEDTTEFQKEMVKIKKRKNGGEI